MNVSLPPRLVQDKPKRPLRLRCPAHLSFVRAHRCCVPGCDGTPIEAAHVRTGTGAGLGFKPDDSQTISLCVSHHRMQHQVGERAFEKMTGIDMKALAAAFWDAFRKANPAAAWRAEAKVRSQTVAGEK